MGESEVRKDRCYRVCHKFDKGEIMSVRFHGIQTMIDASCKDGIEVTGEVPLWRLDGLDRVLSLSYFLGSTGQ